jgi:hypothetical protein
VTSDDELRRFPYRFTGGDIPVEFHRGTVDVIPNGDGSLVGTMISMLGRTRSWSSLTTSATESGGLLEGFSTTVVYSRPRRRRGKG